MDPEIKFPFYAKASLILVGLFAFISMLVLAQQIIVPIIYSVIIAIALSSLVDFFVKKGMNRVLSIAVSLITLCLVIVSLGLLLYTQIGIFTETFPKVVQKFYETLSRSTIWVSEYFNISTQNISSYIANTKAEILNYIRISMTTTFIGIGQGLVIMVLIPIYVFMILFYQPLLLDFIRNISGIQNRKEVDEVLCSTKTIIKKYLIALLLEAAIIATMNSIGLLIIGIDYAILLGILGAIVNVIPFIGGIIAIALPMTIAFVTKNSISYPLMVLGVYIIIQFIDNHYIIPKIVASKVKINALVSIVVVLLGGALWGVPGMFLSIPLTAIVKVICDHIDSLKLFGILLGDTMPAIVLFKFPAKKKIILP